MEHSDIKFIMRKAFVLVLIFSLLIVSCEQSSQHIEKVPTYILNKNSLVYHDPDCKYLPDEKNQVEIEYADIKHHPKWRPCGHCNPK